MPAAIAIPLIIGAASTGAQAYAAKKSSDAAKEAADLQTKAGQKALAMQQRVYQDQVRAQQPYMDMGVQALGQLGQTRQAPTFNPNMQANWSMPSQAPQMPQAYQNPYASLFAQQPLMPQTLGVQNGRGNG